MTAITDFPSELLLTIFKQLNKKDVNQCQYVSRCWSSAAQYQFASEITLSGPAAIQNFIKAINSIGDTTKLKAVKTIVVDNSADLDAYIHTYYLNKDDIQNLFFRFPNLAKIQVKGDLTIFKAFEDEEQCRALFDRFPWLVVQACPEQMYTAKNLYKLRFLWTAFNLNKIDGLLWEFGPAANFLTCAPRLKLLCGFDPLDWMEGELDPVLEKFANLQIIN